MCSQKSTMIFIKIRCCFSLTFWSSYVARNPRASSDTTDSFCKGEDARSLSVGVGGMNAGGCCHSESE